MKHGRFQRHGRATDDYRDPPPTPFQIERKITELVAAGVPRDDAEQIARERMPLPRHGRRPADVPKPWRRPDARKQHEAAGPRQLVLRLGNAVAHVTVRR